MAAPSAPPAPRAPAPRGDLILLGVASPLDLPLVDLANFAGYVLWSGWLVAFGTVLIVRRRSLVKLGTATR